MESPNATSAEGKVLTSIEPGGGGQGWLDCCLAKSIHSRYHSSAISSTCLDRDGDWLLADPTVSIVICFKDHFLASILISASGWVMLQLLSFMTKLSSLLIKVIRFSFQLSIILYPTNKISRHELSIRIILRQFWCLIYWALLMNKIFNLSEINRC